MSPEIVNASSASHRSSNTSDYASCKSDNVSFCSSQSKCNSTTKDSVSDGKGIIDITRKQYLKHYDEFLVNNMVMAFVPFQNYEEDLKRYRSKNSPRQQNTAKLNAKFEKKHNMSLIFPDTFLEGVNNRVRFQRRSDTIATSLIPERIFLVDKTVDVKDVDEDYEPDSCSPLISDDIPIDQVSLIPTNFTGFVTLKNRINRKSTASSTASWYSNVLSRSSYSTLSSGEIDLVKKKAQVKDEHPDIMPKNSTCFVFVRNEQFYTRTRRDYGSEERTRKHDDFMSAKEKTARFKIAFRKSFGFDLGFDTQKLPKESCKGSTFFFDYKNSHGNAVNYEIIFAADTNWPYKITTDWSFRTRVATNTSYSDKWPSETVLKEVKRPKCVISPECAILKKESGFKYTTDKDFEWKIAFPRAEIYLQSTMTHSQTKTYLLLVLLHRSFIEPLTQYNGVRLDHLKMVLYWEMEEGYIQFPQTRMGTKLIDILNRLYRALGKGHLGHYFYGMDKNVFDNVLDRHVKTAQDQIHKILQNPIEYFIAALCNLNYASNDYFPQFDFKKLHLLLTAHHLVSKPSDRVSIRSRKSIQMEEWINLEVRAKVGVDETIRRLRSLKMFIEHFIQVGKVCLSRSSIELGKAYFLQAKDLATILQEQDHHGDYETDIVKYKESIRTSCPGL